MSGSVHQCSQRRQRSPYDHRCGNHPACAPPFDQQRARDLQGYIAEEENADPHAKHAIVESKVASHSNRGIGDAGAVKIVGDVKDKNKWKQPKGNVVPCVVGRPGCAGRNRA